ncbi:unnamed protein product [Chrysoparadoxa australica]
MVELLLRRGAELGARAHRGSTPLIWAAGSGKTACASLLIKAGADVGAHDDAGYSTLHEAARHGLLTIVKKLLSLKADPDALSIGGDTPATYSQRWWARYPQSNVSREKRAAVLDELHKASLSNSRWHARKLAVMLLQRHAMGEDITRGTTRDSDGDVKFRYTDY